MLGRMSFLALCLIWGFAVKASAGELTVVAIGDCMPGGAYESGFCRGADPFGGLRSVLSGADLAIANLEGPLTERGDRRKKKFTFRSSPRYARILAQAGLDVVGLANNHILDFGEEGLRDTKRALSEFGILSCGAGINLAEARRPALFGAGKTRVAILSYNMTFPRSFWAGAERPGTVYGGTEWIREDTRKAREANDIVIVLVHWGAERRHELKSYQRVTAHAAIEAGASLVVGSHPHVAQGIERVGSSVAVYSLGDGVFGGALKREEGSLVMRAVFDSGVLCRVEILPLIASNAATRCSPRLMDADESGPYLSMISRLSGDLGTELDLVDGPGGRCSLRLDLQPPESGRNPVDTGED